MSLKHQRINPSTDESFNGCSVPLQLIVTIHKLTEAHGLTETIGMWNDMFTRMRKVQLAEMLINRNKRRARENMEMDERAIKKAEELDKLEKRLNQLKYQGLSRVSKNGVFLNIRTQGLSRYMVEYLGSYSLEERLKLVVAMRGTEIFKELECLVRLIDLVRSQSGYETLANSII
ncbi:hypothetical protein AgCh_013564 [Apium graveolens]